MADATDLHSFAEELLAASVQALDTIPLASSGLAGAPTRTYVSPGRPAFDNCCGDDGGGQLTVNYVLVAPKQTANVVSGITPKVCAIINLVQFNITIVRCIPSADGPWGEPPTVANLEAAAAQMDADAWALWNHLLNLACSEAFSSLCNEWFPDGLRALDPSGGCGGSVMTIRAEVDGYEEALST